MEPMDSEYLCSYCGVLARKNTGQRVVYKLDGKRVCEKCYYEDMNEPPHIGFFRKIRIWDPPV